MEKIIIIAVFSIIIICSGFYFFKPLKIGSAVEGFNLVAKYDIELNGKTNEVFEFKHKKTGAFVSYLKNKDNHRFFSISFSTPTKDKTGAAHIIEHSVLSSCKKYKDYDLFFNLMKKTPATFLNAMTADGQIFYLFQTINNKDFRNLMDIYLNTALEPELSKDTFNKEAWSLNADKDGNLYYNGVVYNEMKNAYSEVFRTIYMEMLETLSPKYEFESGGDPRFITDLTYENYLNFYKNTHNPSNSFTFIYGDGDMKKELKLLNEEFSKFEKKEPVKLDYQNLIIDKPVEKIISYPAGKGEDKSYIIYSYVKGDISDILVKQDVAVLEFLLNGYEDAILRKRVLDSGLATGVNIETFDIKNKSGFWILFFGVEQKNEKKLQDLVETIFKEISEKGFEKLPEEAIKSAQRYGIKRENRNEFQDKIFDMYLTYLFGGDYKDCLDKERIYKDFSERVNQSNYTKNLFETYILNNKQSAKITARPDEKMFDKQEAELNKKLAKIKKELTSEELKKIRQETIIREKNAPNSEAEFPILKISDWTNKPEKTPTEELNLDGVKVLNHNLKSNGLTQIIFAFDITGLSEKDTYVLGLWDLLADKLDTIKMSNGDFALNKIKTTGSDFNFYPNGFYKKDKSFETRYLTFVKSFDNNLPETFSLLGENMYNLDFSNKNKIKEIITRKVKTYEMNYRQKGEPMFKEISESKIFDNRTEGYYFYTYLKDLLKNFDKNYPSLIKDLENIQLKVFNKNNLVIDVVGDDINLESLENFIKTLSKTPHSNEANYKINKKSEARIVPARNYENYLSCDLENYEQWKSVFFPAFIRGNYLMPEIRIKGGAYGANLSIDNSGKMLFFSYADPNVIKTFETYKNTENFWKNFKAQNKDFDSMKIKALANYSKPETSFGKGIKAINMYLQGRTFEEREADFEKIKNLTQSDINALAKDFENCKKNYILGTSGPKTEIEKNKKLYDEVK